LKTNCCFENFSGFLYQIQFKSQNFNSALAKRMKFNHRILTTRQKLEKPFASTVYRITATRHKRGTTCTGSLFHKIHQQKMKRRMKNRRHITMVRTVGGTAASIALSARLPVALLANLATAVGRALARSAVLFRIVDVELDRRAIRVQRHCYTETQKSNNFCLQNTKKMKEFTARAKTSIRFVINRPATRALAA
jgi:hypothetical protein